MGLAFPFRHYQSFFCPPAILSRSTFNIPQTGYISPEAMGLWPHRPGFDYRLHGILFCSHQIRALGCSQVCGGFPGADRRPSTLLYFHISCTFEVAQLGSLSSTLILSGFAPYIFTITMPISVLATNISMYLRYLRRSIGYPLYSPSLTQNRPQNKVSGRYRTIATHPFTEAGSVTSGVKSIMNVDPEHWSLVFSVRHEDESRRLLPHPDPRYHVVQRCRLR